jgi:single-stranded-DNA-specific exonuclease
MKWTIKSQIPAEACKLLESKLGKDGRDFPKALATVLVQRGIENFEDAKKFLQPATVALFDPFEMKDMSKACDRIQLALRQKETVLIYGDYDVDGTTSVSLLQLFFEDLGHSFETYVPNRFTEGYGISFEGVDYAASKGCTLLIALDCGTKAVDKVRFANGKGIDVIVVDHHKPGDELPEVVAMLNPLQGGCAYPDKDLSACALTFKLCQALVLRAHETEELVLPQDYDLLSKYSDLVAVSIACDIVPLRGENRVLAAIGLEKFRKNPSAGLAALKSLNEGDREWSISDLVFYIGPRINSAGRLMHATEAVALLTGKAENLHAVAASLDGRNEERKDLDKQMTAVALSMILEEEGENRRASTVLFDESWSKGVIGIVASRLIERHHRPTILLTRSGENLVGSGRSVPGFDLYDAIETCSEHLLQFGGHKYAAGLTLKESEYPAFRAKFDNVVANRLKESQKTAELMIDTMLEFRELDERFIRLLRRLAPFGPSNPEPNFLASKVKVKECNILKKEHVKLILDQGGNTFEAIGFFLAERWAAVNALEIDVVFQPDLKSWNGKTYIQLKMKDFRQAISTEN